MLGILILAVMILITGMGTSATNGDLAATTTYDYSWWNLATVRNKLDTTYKSKSTSYSAYSTVDTFENKKAYAVNHSFDDARTKSSSVKLGSKVTVKAIQVEAGTDVKYSNTKTYHTDVKVKKKSKATLYVRTKTEKLKYSSKVQKQDFHYDLRAKKTKWRNIGSPCTASSTQTVLSPYWMLK